jgi:hypothetical protein
MTSTGGKPARIMRVIAVCLQSWKWKSTMPASRHIFFHDVLIVTLTPKTKASLLVDDACQSLDSSE